LCNVLKKTPFTSYIPKREYLPFWNETRSLCVLSIVTTERGTQIVGEAYLKSMLSVINLCVAHPRVQALENISGVLCKPLLDAYPRIGHVFRGGHISTLSLLEVYERHLIANLKLNAIT